MAIYFDKACVPCCLVNVLCKDFGAWHWDKICM